MNHELFLTIVLMISVINSIFCVQFLPHNRSSNYLKRKEMGNYEKRPLSPFTSSSILESFILHQLLWLCDIFQQLKRWQRKLFNFASCSMFISITMFLPFYPSFLSKLYFLNLYNILTYLLCFEKKIRAYLN